MLTIGTFHPCIISHYFQIEQGGLAPPGTAITNGDVGGSSPPYVNRDSPGDNTQGICSGTSAVSDCPYNLYRTSGDINPNFAHIMYNINTVVRYLGSATEAPLSRPGAWAYPECVLLPSSLYSCAFCGWHR
eukprot:COSAG02_NODE_194_length_29788_cov_20.044090_21_plen_131_part_00